MKKAQNRLNSPTSRKRLPISSKKPATPAGETALKFSYIFTAGNFRYLAVPCCKNSRATMRRTLSRYGDHAAGMKPKPKANLLVGWAECGESPNFRQAVLIEIWSLF